MKKKTTRKLCLLLVLLLIAGFLIKGYVNLRNAANQFASSYGSSYLSMELQETLYAFLEKKQSQYTEIKYDPSGKVTALSVDNAVVNLLSTELTGIVVETLSSFSSPEFGIPLGNVFSDVLLSGRGPVIPVKPVLAGNAATKIDTVLQSVGINQSLHRVFITFDIAVVYLAPFETVTDSLRFDIVLSETLIVGDVPLVYGS